MGKYFIGVEKHAKKDLETHFKSIKLQLKE